MLSTDKTDDTLQYLDETAQKVKGSHFTSPANGFTLLALLTNKQFS
jgi:hypothetical protein